jgi:pimeloyl-ACP methyl ester carboxylesterase
MTHSLDLQFDVSVGLPGDVPSRMAATLWLPQQPAAAPRIWCCLPGGNMNRGYYDLRPPDAPDDDSYSFATQMTARGDLVAAFDYLGIGGSTRPEDGYLLTPDRLTAANAQAVGALLLQLRAGQLGGVPALPVLPAIGVGHSMGAMMTVLLQAQARPYDAVVLLGFSTRGLPEYLSADVRELAQDVPTVRARLVELSKTMFPVPYPVIRSSGNGAELYGSAKAEPAGVAALKRATEHVLAVPAFLSMLPGNVAPEAAQIDVPLFLGLGERDMAGPTHQIPAAFPASGDVTLQILPETGHSHFLFPTREHLFARLAHWIRGVRS